MKKEYFIPRVKFCKLTTNLGYAATGGNVQGTTEDYGRVNEGQDFWSD